MHDNRPLALAGALLGLLAGALAATGQFLPVVLDRHPSNLGFLVMGTNVVSLLVSPVALFGVGYWVGTDVDVTTEWASIALVVGLVGGAATLVGYLVVALLSVRPDAGREITMIVVTAGYTAIVRVFDFAITGLAGAAVAEFRGA
ncbi:hypothetical protein ACFQH6_16615 [Halobacteriaceae archaeon GCM10025711]